MLILSRKIGEKIVIGNDITVTLLEIQGHKVRLGIEAPRDVPVHREEIAKLIEETRLATERQTTPDTSPAEPTATTQD